MCYHTFITKKIKMKIKLMEIGEEWMGREVGGEVWDQGPMTIRA